MNTLKRLGLCLAVAAAATLAVSCGRAPVSNWQDGVYQGKAEGMHGNIELTVTVEKGRIARIVIDKQSETAGVSDLALKRVPEEIITKQTADVDSVAGASISSKAIMAAAQDALAKARKQ